MTCTNTEFNKETENSRATRGRKSGHVPRSCHIVVLAEPRGQRVRGPQEGEGSSVLAGGAGKAPQKQRHLTPACRSSSPSPLPLTEAFDFLELEKNIPLPELSSRALCFLFIFMTVLGLFSGSLHAGLQPLWTSHKPDLGLDCASSSPPRTRQPGLVQRRCSRNLLSVQ